MNGSIDPALPSFLSLTSATSPPNLLVLFHEPWRATKIWFLYFAGNDVAGVELHAERGRVRPHQGDRRRELAALAAPAEFLIGNIALIAIRRAEVLADLGHAIELVVGEILRHPVAAVVGEVQFLGFGCQSKPTVLRMPCAIVSMPLPSRLTRRMVAVALGRQAVVAGLADLEIELVVGSDREDTSSRGLRPSAGRRGSRSASADCRACPRCCRSSRAATAP